MDRYEVLHHQRLGSGTFGTVTVGKELASGRHVAMKFISKRDKQDSEISNLKKECEIQKHLRHPNVIQMLDSFETDREIVVVTELAQGDLYKILPQNTRWNPKVVRKIACDLVSALHFLHSQRILHRDLKPQNILLGIDGKAKLCDFGFAKMVAMNSFMLTSMKGTPLYMAPEILLEQPYDQTADLWSLGCILYELFAGQPPFSTNSLFVLRKMMLENAVEWHDCIFGDARSFLQGLLEKDPKKRLNWPNLQNHPYIMGKLAIDWSVTEHALTKALSPSMELVKETERLKLQRKLEQCSKAYRKAMKKYKGVEKELKRWKSDAAIGRMKPYALCDPNLVPMLNNMHRAAIKKQIMDHPQNVAMMIQNMTINDKNNAQVCDKVKSPEKRESTSQKGNSNIPSSPSDDTTSSSDCETESDDDSDEDDRKTVVPDEIYQKKSTESRNSGNLQRHSVEIRAENDDCSGESKILFTLDTSGSTEFETDTGEWMCFLRKNMKEVVQSPEALCDKPFLRMVLDPLKSTSAQPIVIENIAILLHFPFVLDENVHVTLPTVIADLQSVYASTKVLPLLLFASKLIVINRVHGLSLTLDQICEQLTAEDLSALEECFLLVNLLIHLDETFVTQFCDSVCVLKLSAILKLFLRLHQLQAVTVTVLSHLLRILPDNKSIVEDVILGPQKNNHSSGITNQELYKLMSHADPLVQSKSIRLFTCLLKTSPRFKNDFVMKYRSTVWNILRKCSLSPDSSLRKAATLALQVVSGNPKFGQSHLLDVKMIPPASEKAVKVQTDAWETACSSSQKATKSIDVQEDELETAQIMLEPPENEDIQAVVVACSEKNVKCSTTPGHNNDASR